MYGPGLAIAAQYWAEYGRYQFLMMPMLAFKKYKAARFFGGTRDAREIKEIILHDTDSRDNGSFEKTLSYLADPSPDAPKSIHYLIGREFGQIYAMVPEGVVAYHALSHNRHAIGIEMYKKHSEKGDFTDWQYEAVSQLVYDLMLRYGIPRDKVISHASIQSWDR